MSQKNRSLKWVARATVGTIAVLASRDVSAAVIENFEEYTSTAQLQAAWPVAAATSGNTSDALSTTPADAYDGSNSLELAYNEGASPYYSVVRYTLPAAQNWSGDSAWSVYYLGEGAANSDERLVFSLFDSYGDTIGSTTIAGGTQAATYTQSLMPLSTYTGGDGVSDVDAIQIAVAATDYGSGTMYFDGITTVPVPEPTTLAVVLGPPLVRRRRRALS